MIFEGKFSFQPFDSYLNVLVIKTLISQYFTQKLIETMTVPKLGRGSGCYKLIYITAWILFMRKLTVKGPIF